MAKLQGNYTAEEMAPLKKALNNSGINTDNAPALNGPTAGTIAADQVKNFDPAERDRYRSMGEVAANRQAVNVDFSASQADRAAGQTDRFMQNDALAMQRQAAQGNAPSRAEIMGAQAGGQSLDAAMAAQAGARPGGMAAAAAMAQRGMGAGQLGAMGQGMAGRSAEMNDARGQYFSGATGMRAGDYTAMGLSQQQAEAQAQAEIAQRHLNQQGQMGYEQMGINREQQQSDEQLRRMAIEAQKRGGDAAVAQAALERNKTDAIAAGSMGLGVISGGARGGSDERMKGNVVPLSEEPGTERHYDRDVSAAGPDVTSGASLSGPTPRYGIAQAAAAAAPQQAAPPKTRKYTDAELNRMADQMLGGMKSRHEAQLAEGPAVKDRGDVGHALEKGLAPFQYEYKPEFAGAERQGGGEKNVGPMAQNMASNPVTGTAVKQGGDGLLYIDQPKALKLSLGGVGYLAAKQRELEAELASMKGRR